MPCDRSRYPDDWPPIRVRILARARNCCERCGVANGSEILYATNGRRCYVGGDQEWRDRRGNLCPRPHADEQRPSRKIVLTIAHLDHDTANNPDDNLSALCQRCHLAHDAGQHAANASATRRRRKGDAGQLTLEGV